jgi:hypothetical protein
MGDVRKILIIFVIGILFALFVHSFIDAVHPAPEYNDYCTEFEKPMPAMTEKIQCPQISMPRCEGLMDYEYDENGCPISATCNPCTLNYNNAREKHNFLYFILSAIFGLSAISVALFLPLKKNELHQWIGTGFMLGGLISLFIGTAIYYGDMARMLRPAIILLEMMIIIYIAYKKIKL